MRTDNRTLGLALEYGSRGWPVIPLHWPVTVGAKAGRGRARCSCRSGSCEAQGKHPRTQHGLKDASCDPAVIRQWWTQWPRANLGLVTGSSFDALDIDGSDALDLLGKVSSGLPLPHGPLVSTGRGWHLYLRATGQGNRAGLLPGVDWRGQGGYVVAPPSLHPSGKAYQWSQGLELELPECPGWLLDLLTPQSPPDREKGVRFIYLTPPDAQQKGYAQAALEAECTAVSLAASGQRNHALNKGAFNLGQLVPHLLSEGTVTAALTDAGLRTGLSPREVESTIRSGLEAGARKPRARR